MIVIWPPRANPNVTAGLTCPPEMLAPIATATNRARPWHTAIATNPAGSRAPPDVNLPVAAKNTTTSINCHNCMEFNETQYADINYITYSFMNYDIN